MFKRTTRIDYKSAKEKCLKENRLFEDHEFPAIDSSIFYSKAPARGTIWKRPTEIYDQPLFQVGGMTRCDLDQGAIGDCWFIAAVATVATYPDLIEKIVPPNQSFQDEYAGIFRFFFWRYGEWVEVVVDDRLPTRGGRLIFCKNRDAYGQQTNEFWSALLEKAYAKLHGSYEALSGGKVQSALVDLTGGITEIMDLTNEDTLPENLYGLILKMFKKQSLMGCCIANKGSTTIREEKLPNGLIKGHAYSITRVVKGKIDGRNMQLIRLRNPWGASEWNGAWSDNSIECQDVPRHVRQELGMVIEEDGEFWMSMDDWFQNFTEMQICHLSPESFKTKVKRDWTVKEHNGSWVRGVSSGGCGNPPHEDMYWYNPQYLIRLEDPDEDDDDKKCTLIISLTQKHRRLMRSHLRVSYANLAIGFDIYRVKDNVRESLDGHNFDKRAMMMKRRCTKYLQYRETCDRFRFRPGLYCIIPATFKPGANGDFMLRVFTETSVYTEEIDDVTEPILAPEPEHDLLLSLFRRHCGEDQAIDAKELRIILNEAFYTDFNSTVGLEMEAARSLLAMLDTGVLEYDELKRLWTEVKVWRNVFEQFDKDNSGYMDVKEIRKAFKAIGFKMSKKALRSIVLRHGGKEGLVDVADFILCSSKVTTLYNRFAIGNNEGKERFDEWIQIAMSY
ncbi:unnamed protein product [Owenia fusiformis]|uniref:Uncharacterized protein n=1 Tax=Owenia fusiformis TaxID=6347 RepID=A0A8S4PGK4_OWEFU|nr:unnamed protein product [Owenia fusiformis]